MEITLHPHAAQRMEERGASLQDVIDTIKEGESFPAKFNRTGFRRNFLFDSYFSGKHYYTKQIEVFAVKEEEDWLVITQ